VGEPPPGTDPRTPVEMIDLRPLKRRPRD